MSKSPSTLKLGNSKVMGPDTTWWDAMPADQKQAAFADFAAKAPVGRSGRPEDLAQASGLLINNSFVTGLVPPVDGGLRFTA